MTWQDEANEIQRRKTLALAQGGDAAIDKQHSQGRLTIRERIDALIDPGSLEEIGPAAGTGHYDQDNNLIDFDPANFILGFAMIHGRRVVVGGEDFTLRGGSPSPAGLRKSVYAEELALQYKVPLVRLHEGSGGCLLYTSPSPRD